jgi:hypothetical protein
MPPKLLSRPRSNYDAVCLTWFALDTFTHLSIELLYVIFAVSGGAANSNHPLAL